MDHNGANVEEGPRLYLREEAISKRGVTAEQLNKTSIQTTKIKTKNKTN